MNQHFVKPMSADYARLVATTANTNATRPTHESAAVSDSRRRRACSFSLFRSRRRDSKSVDLRVDAASTATSAATLAADDDTITNTDDNVATDAATLRKQTWWRQHVVSQSMPAMLNAQTRR